MSPDDFGFKTDFYLIINRRIVFTARPLDGFPRGHLALSGEQRRSAGVSEYDGLECERYNPARQSYLGAMDLEVGAPSKKTNYPTYDQDELANFFIKVRLMVIVAMAKALITDCL